MRDSKVIKLIYMKILNQNNNKYLLRGMFYLTLQAALEFELKGVWSLREPTCRRKDDHVAFKYNLNKNNIHA